jgi:L-threonylcarbamoyladenylate synthase
MRSAGLSPIFAMSDSHAHTAGISAAVAALRAGNLVGMPTETVYGLAADAANGEAVARIFAAKGRPRFNPLIIHVGSLAEAATIAGFSTGARSLAEACWPGPLTLVLPKRPEAAITSLATVGLDTVAIRVPAHPVARELLLAFGGPIAAPSANRSGHVSPTTAAHVAADLGQDVACILDAGATAIGIESTIVGMSNDEAFLLRPGGLERNAIEAILGKKLEAPAEPSEVTAPGMLTSHYAPKASLRLNATDIRPGEALLAFGANPAPGAGDAVVVRNLSESGDLTEAAANFFSALRELDGEVRTIAVMPIPENGLGEAINDRLRRAAAPRDAG